LTRCMAWSRMHMNNAHLRMREKDMPQRTSDTKEAINLSIDAELAAEAKEAGTNMSALLEKGAERGIARTPLAEVA
jgi:post-segregation antitoxin (ccd killing protein)